MSWRESTKSCLLKGEKLSVMTHEPRDSCKMGNPLPSRTLPCTLVPSTGRYLAGATPRLSRPPVHGDCPHAATGALRMGIWKDIHPSWGKSAMNLQSCSPILAISVSRTLGSKLFRVATGSGNGGKDCKDTEAALPVSIAPSDSYAIAEAGGTAEAEELPHSSV